ncbi:MAG: ISAzo13 family transposase [Dehalococcoidales bacterium]|nr:ISAzo13 family transposase [Dehalococcoidales bacterium]
MDTELIKRRFTALAGFLDERLRRLVAATEAMAIGYGGISIVSRETGVSRRAIALGCEELKHPEKATKKRIRKEGGGRKRTIDKDSTLRQDLENLIEPVSRGDPESPLRWTCKSVRKLSAELKQMGHNISHNLVAELLHRMGYSLQSNQKTIEETSHPDRGAQFEHINNKVKGYQAIKQPVISVDTKKKELVGDFKNGGRELRPKGNPEKVRVHDFEIPELGKDSPYGVYDVTCNLGWVNVGIDHDTAAFAVESIRRWWQLMGQGRYPEAKQLLITADSGGSNGYRTKLWKVELQKLATETGLAISVCHLPPGTSKWNKIEHRLFSFISQNWRGKPLVSHEVIVNLIAATTTREGLRVQCQLDTKSYAAGIKVSDKEMASVNIQRDLFHGEWNYTISPARPQDSMFIS